MKKIVKLGMILAVFCVLSAGILAAVYLFTQPRIESNSKSAFISSMREVLPEANSFKSLKCGEGKVYAGMKGKERVGAAVLIEQRGYGGTIEILVGIDLAGTIKGMKILNHRETPGLGAGISAPGFLKQFMGKTTKDPIEAKNDIEAITGATISSRAVCVGAMKALKEAEGCAKENK